MTTHDTASVEKARASALRLLKARDRTRMVLGLRLRAKGFEAGVVEEVLDRLETAGLLDERATARRLVEREIRKGAATARLLRARLLSEGVTAAVADEAVAEALEGVDPEAAAEGEARRWLLRQTDPDPRATARRLSARLARRGFDGEIVRRVVDRVLAGAEDI